MIGKKRLAFRRVTGSRGAPWPSLVHSPEALAGPAASSTSAACRPASSRAPAAVGAHRHGRRDGRDPGLVWSAREAPPTTTPSPAPRPSIPISSGSRSISAEFRSRPSASPRNRRSCRRRRTPSRVADVTATPRPRSPALRRQPRARRAPERRARTAPRGRQRRVSRAGIRWRPLATSDRRCPPRPSAHSGAHATGTRKSIPSSAQTPTTCRHGGTPAARACAARPSRPASPSAPTASGEPRTPSSKAPSSRPCSRIGSTAPSAGR